MKNGQKVIETLATWFRSYMVMPTEWSIVCALWAAHTHVFQNFGATPRLCVSAATKGSGKSILTELVSFLCHNGEFFVDPTPAVLYRTLEMYDGHCAILIDEAEKLSGESARTFRSMANTGYRAGATLPRTGRDGKPFKFGVFCPLGFDLIGDVYDTLRDRSIVLQLRKATPTELLRTKKYRQPEAKAESIQMKKDLRAFMSTVQEIETVEISHLSGRDEEIWYPLFCLAKTLGFDAEAMETLVTVSTDLTSAKTAAARRYSDIDTRKAEDEAMEISYSERAVKDLATILQADEKAIFSAVAVERLLKIPSAPWRFFRGQAITQRTLAQLIQPIVGTTKTVRPGSGKKAPTGMGWTREQIRNGIVSICGEQIAHGPVD